MAETESAEKTALRSLIRTIPDFPAPGVQFRDIFPIFKNPTALSTAIELLTTEVKKFGKVDVIAGLDARGFLFAPIIAMNLGAAFVPIRKAGKLPGKTVQLKSTKEYGQVIRCASNPPENMVVSGKHYLNRFIAFVQYDDPIILIAKKYITKSCHTRLIHEDILEMQADAITPGQSVVIVDDVLATGGTMLTSCELVKQQNGNLLGCVVLIGLKEFSSTKLPVKCLSILLY